MLVAVIEDHQELRIALGRMLRAGGYDTALFESAESYLAAQLPTPECLVVDVHLPGMSGIDLLRHLRALPPTPRIILTSADNSVADHAKAMGCDAFLLKPVRSETLMSTIEALVQDPADRD